MNKIASFEVDHTKLNRGLYVSRVDNVGNTCVTTYDVRIRKPNVIGMEGKAMHTIEHLAATFLRNDEDWRDQVVYWGPMGCKTGFYLIIKGEHDSRYIVGIMRRLFAFIAGYEGDVPGCTRKECGNYMYHDLQGAKREAADFCKVLDYLTEENLIYPK